MDKNKIKSWLKRSKKVPKRDKIEKEYVKWYKIEKKMCK